MNYASLLRANLCRNPTRTILTAICLVIAFLLFGLLQPLGKIFSEGPVSAVASRLVVTPKHSVVDMLPVSYWSQIQQTEGVVSVAHTTWFGGTYIDANNSFPQYAVTPVEYLAVVKEIQLPTEQREAFISNRQAAIVGKEIAEKFNWQIGDRISLIPNIWHNRDARAWDFDLVGIFESADTSVVNNNGFYFSYEYFDSYRSFGQGTVGSFLILAREQTQINALAKQIDAAFANSTAETKTLSEREFALSFAKQMGNVGLIVSVILCAVFFTIVLLASNTIAQTVRERIPEFAVMKVLGFRSSTILCMIVVEAILLTITAACLGLLCAQGLLSQIGNLVPQLKQVGAINVTFDIAFLALVIALSIGVFVALPPAIKAMRLSVADALRG